MMFKRKATKQEVKELRDEIEKLREELKLATTIYVDTGKIKKETVSNNYFPFYYSFPLPELYEISIKDFLRSNLLPHLKLSIYYQEGVECKVMLKKNK